MGDILKNIPSPNLLGGNTSLYELKGGGSRRRKRKTARRRSKRKGVSRRNTIH